MMRSGSSRKGFNDWMRECRGFAGVMMKKIFVGFCKD